jgi:hypothetical protein
MCDSGCTVQWTGELCASDSLNCFNPRTKSRRLPSRLLYTEFRYTLEQASRFDPPILLVDPRRGAQAPCRVFQAETTRGVGGDQSADSPGRTAIWRKPDPRDRPWSPI